MLNIRQLPDRLKKSPSINVLGLKGAKIEYICLVLFAYMSIPLLIVTGMLASWSMIVFLSIPVALRNIKMINQSIESKPEEIASADEETAKLHFLFGMLLLISIILGIFL